MAAQDRNRDRASAGLLRRTLASAGSAAEPCPDPEILAAYAERSLDADETAHCELHFAQCAACRDQLAAMVRAAAPAPRTPRISWIWTWGWMALAPVAAVLLIAALFIARQSKRETPSVAQLQPLVAMSRSDESVANANAPPSEPHEISALPAPSKSNAAPVTRAKSGISHNADQAPNKIPTASGTVPTNAEFAQTPAPAPLEEKKLDESSRQLPLSARNYSALGAASGVPAPPAPKPALPRAAAQTVTVQSAGDAITEASAQDTLADSSAGNAPSEAPAAGGNLPLSTLAAGAANQMVAVEAPLNRSARTLVQSPDPQVLWRISGGRYVERSADAGATWHAQWTSATAHVVAGSAPSSDTCWLVGSGGIVLVSTDARRWHTLTPPEVADFTAVSASDAESATITTKDGRQFKTRDGGKHWSPAP